MSLCFTYIFKNLIIIKKVWLPVRYLNQCKIEYRYL